MFLATVVLLAIPQAAIPHDTPESPVATESSSKNVNSRAAKLPETPAPKAANADDSMKTGDAVSTDLMPAAIRPANAAPAAPIKPAYKREYENERQKKVWYGLMAASHSAAVFDAWSTRRAVSGGYGTEANPFLRGASHSNMIYVATQVSPVLMDYLGKKMMTSRHGWMRKMWWLPQTAGTGFSISAGVHNTLLVP